MNDTVGIPQVSMGEWKTAPPRCCDRKRDLTHLSDASGRGLGVSLPNKYTSRVARGAASEMIAAAYLMAQGFHVFRAMAASCPVDLIAHRTGETPLRVEVKSVFISNPSSQSPSPAFSTPANQEWDLLALVGMDGSVVLLPPAPVDDLRAAYRKAIGLAAKTEATLATHCRRGHEFTSDNTGRTARGARTCRRCSRDRHALSRVRALQRTATPVRLGMELS